MAIEKSLLTFISDRAVAIVTTIESDTKETETKARATEAVLFITQLRNAIVELCESNTSKSGRGRKGGEE